MVPLKMLNKTPKARIYVLGLLLSLCMTMLPAHAEFVVPSGKQQQSAMLTSFYYQVALQFASQGEAFQAADLARKIYELNRDNIEISFSYGRFLESQGKDEEALAVYHEALNHFKEPLYLSSLQYEISSVYARQMKSKQAIDALKKAITLYPGQPPASFYYDLGVYYAQLNRYDETNLYSKKAIDLVPDSAAAWNNYGYSLVKLGRYEEGFGAIQKSLDLEPNNPNTLDSMGFVLFKMGRFKESIVQYEKAVKLDPRMSESFLYLARSYEARQAWSKAISSYERYLQLSTDLKEKATVANRLKLLRKRQHSSGSNLCKD